MTRYANRGAVAAAWIGNDDKGKRGLIILLGSRQWNGAVATVIEFADAASRHKIAVTFDNWT
jgi:hypothetical protein